MKSTPLYLLALLVLCISLPVHADGAPTCKRYACITFGKNEKNNTSFYFEPLDKSKALICWFNIDGWKYNFRLTDTSQRFHLRYGFNHTQVLWRCDRGM